MIYQIRRVELAEGKVVHCIWLSRDPEESAAALGPSFANLTLASSLNSSSTQNASLCTSASAGNSVPAENPVSDNEIQNDGQEDGREQLSVNPSAIPVDVSAYDESTTQRVLLSGLIVYCSTFGFTTCIIIMLTPMIV